ncbi:unnamed protein product [Pylaiella littoralis]
MALARVRGQSGAAQQIAVELVHRGVAFVKRKAVRVAARTRDRLTRFMFDREEPPSGQPMTIVITSVAEENLYNADLFVGPHDGGTIISVTALHEHINRLIVGTLGITVRDLGHFTRGGTPPYCMLIGLDAVLSLARQHWIYEKFSEYQKGLESVTIVKLRSRYNSRSIVRLVWDNSESPSRSQAQVLNEREWKNSKYRGKSKALHGLTDVGLLIHNNGRVLAFL